MHRVGGNVNDKLNAVIPTLDCKDTPTENPRQPQKAMHLIISTISK